MTYSPPSYIIAPHESKIELMLKSNPRLAKLYETTIAEFRKANEKDLKAREEATRITPRDLFRIVACA